MPSEGMDQFYPRGWFESLPTYDLPVHNEAYAKYDYISTEPGKRMADPTIEYGLSFRLVLKKEDYTTGVDHDKTHKPKTGLFKSRRKFRIENGQMCEILEHEQWLLMRRMVQVRSERELYTRSMCLRR
jgi:hypothetical protein